MEVFTSSCMEVLPYAASSVGIARRRLLSDLADAGVNEGTACDAGLVISELISNALRHATPLPDHTIKAFWRLRQGSMEIAVSDGGGSTLPAVSEPARWAVGGRGLGIVERLSRCWGVSDGDGEVTVWAELPVHYASAQSRLVTASARDA